MVKRKKKAWNMSNPLYRYLHGKGKAKAKPARVKHKRVKKMSRRSRRVSHSSPRGIMKGLYTPKGIIASMLLGAGAATLAEKVLPNVIPYQGEAIGFAVGGVGGALGAFSRGALKNLNVGGSTGSSYGNY